VIGVASATVTEPQPVRRGIAGRGRHHGEPSTRSIDKEVTMHTIDRGVTYLDLDGDGVVDAVLTTETWPTPPDQVDRPTVVETLEEGIDIDGHPSVVKVLSHR
jgi:hypothetical protein